MPFSFDHLKTLFKPRAAKVAGEKLYASCVTQARQPVFYIDYAIEDAIGARFELLTFHVGLVIYTLKALAANDPRREQAQETAQALFDSFILALDTTLREQGTGDLSVPKKMKPLAQIVYTRMKRWDDLWTHKAGLDAQADYAARTIFAGAAFAGDGEADDGAVTATVLPRALAFAGYGVAARSGLAVDAILQGRLDWCEIAQIADKVAAESPAAAQS